MSTDETRNSRFAVCFDGARDNYEAAVALAEVGRLEMLVTDVYLGAAVIRPWARALTAASVPRYRDEIPPALVRSFPSALLARRFRTASQLIGAPQEVLARRFAKMTSRRPVDLLAYAGYARPAFDGADRSRRKILFQYHPHRVYEREALEAAGVQYPIFPQDPDDLGNLEEMDAADAIVCASSFTRRSIERVLGPEKPIIVAPYGSNISIPPGEVLERRRLLSGRHSHGLRTLFVGSGLPRKGIELLLKAWQVVASPADRLTLVVRDVHPSTRPLLAQAGDTAVVRSNLSRALLLTEFLSADVFAFPSLSEGFGHVVPEALSLGCYTIASNATCLADVRVPANTGRVVPAGQLEPLVTALEEARQLHAANSIDHGAICSLGESFRWETFRHLVRTACLQEK